MEITAELQHNPPEFIALILDWTMAITATLEKDQGIQGIIRITGTKGEEGI